ncbi:MAG: MBL fold metallo-hydrolase RNA specificity domain-containing protein [Pirellulaceae bacterium]|nr:hypothetical protein [Planctomycetales bacterium]
MFYFDRGLFLTRNRLAVDVRRRQRRGFISHAHADHVASHATILCSLPTAELVRERFGYGPVQAIPWGQTVTCDGVELQLFPAGHILGSAMLLANDDSESLLYTGDFQLEPSLTCEPVEVPQADILVMECTFGDPRYRFPSKRDVYEQLIASVSDAISWGRTPVVHAYALGKSQEVARVLTNAGITVLEHSLIHALSQIYAKHGFPTGGALLPEAGAPSGVCVIAPPRSQKAVAVKTSDLPFRIAVTGWALDPNARVRLRVDRAFPLSDHADFDELMRAVEVVGPRRVYTTHGPASFSDHLRRAGIDATPLEKTHTGR